jgi:CheY-like chemotaxis protein
MAQQLKKAKCEVHVANHGADALFFLEKTTFQKECGPYATPLSIILMDLEMPGKSSLAPSIDQHANNLSSDGWIDLHTTNQRMAKARQIDKASTCDCSKSISRHPMFLTLTRRTGHSQCPQ